MATKNTILVAGNPLQKELPAAAAITPGHLIKVTTAGKFAVHDGAGQNAQPIFAKEQWWESIDDPYAQDDQVLGLYTRNGDEIFALLADGQNVAVGDFLESAGDGTLRKHTPQAVNEGGTATYTVYNRAVVAVAKEALNNSSGSAARLLVESV